MPHDGTNEVHLNEDWSNLEKSIELLKKLGKDTSVEENTIKELKEFKARRAEKKEKKKPRPTAAPPKKLSELEEQDEYFFYYSRRYAA